MPKNPKILFTLGGFWAFFGFGFIDNLKGPLLPEMVRSGRFDYAQSGGLIFASYLVSSLPRWVVVLWRIDIVIAPSCGWLAGACC